MRKTLVAFAALCIGLSLAAASEAAPIVAVADFAVYSSNPRYAQLGKGFAELVAYELGKSPAIKLVDRSERNLLLSEIEFSYAGAAEDGARLEAGKLLAVRYLVVGSITDMGGVLLVKLSMLDSQTGEVVWGDKLSEPPERYDYIGAYFGKSILKHFKAKAARSTEAAIAAKAEKNAASVLALSSGLASIDAGEKEAARKELAEAAKLDPGNAVAAAFLGRLAAGSARVKVVPERYVPYYNPAYLAGLAKDRLLFGFAYLSPVVGEYAGDTNVQVVDPSGEVATRETKGEGRLGYACPVRDGLGLGFDFVFMRGQYSLLNYADPTHYGIAADEPLDLYGLLSIGAEVSPRLSLGAGLSATYVYRKYLLHSWPGDNVPFRYDPYVAAGGLVAAALRNDRGNLAWDIEAAYNREPLFWYDRAADAFVEYRSPLYVEQTLSLALGGRGSYLAIKQLNDIYFDRSWYFGRIMPCLEFRLGRSSSFRFGVEGSLFDQAGAIRYGWGGTAGATFRALGCDLDLNATLRMRPSYLLADTFITEGIAFVTVTRSPAFGK